MSVSIVLPCYNPPMGWEQTIFSTYNALSQSLTGIELVVVMDGGNISTAEAAIAFLEKNTPGIKLIRYAENRGKGYAIRQGVAAAGGEIIIYTDVDFPYTLESLLEIYNGLAKNEYDIGIGVKNAAYYAHVPPLRRAISRFLRFLTGLFLSMPITDTQCGLKGFKRDVAPLFLATTIDRYLFDLEFVRNSFKSRKYRIRAVPVTLNENVHFRKMDYRILLPEMVNFIKLLFK